MSRAIFTAVAMLFVAFGAVAQDQGMSMSQDEHLAHLRELLATRSSHGPVIPQPQDVTAAATKNFTITATSFTFAVSPSPFTVNQGDVVNITLKVPSNDASTIGHGILMESYIENGLNCSRGGTVTFQFTATTFGQFAFVCNLPDCGTGHSSMFGTLKVNQVTNPAPTITGIDPTNGSSLGGTATTITGTGFLAGATVKFGGTSATNVSVVSATSITATTPAHAAGAADVLVTNSDNKSATLPQAFTFDLPAPAISGVAPSTGPTTGGTPVTITGTDFQAGASVMFGAQPATDVTVVSATSITARAPLGPATQQLAVDVVVTNPDSQSATAHPGFTYTVPPLAVVSVTPNITLPAVPVTITIFGAGFTSALASSVSIGGIAATNVQVVDPVTIRATVPAHALGTSDVVVTVGGTSATLKNGISWQNPPPKKRAVKH
jgi:hypothetical protein